MSVVFSSVVLLQLVKMSRSGYTNEDFLNLIITYGECGRIIERTCRVYAEKYPDRPRPTGDVLRRLLHNCTAFGSFLPKTTKNKPVVDGDDTQVTVIAYFNAHPTNSLQDAERDVGVSRKSIHRILQQNKWHPYKFQRVQHLRETDFEARVQFCEWFLLKSQEDENFTRHVIWTDESKFGKNGLFNRHNSHFWSDDNPRAVRQRNFQEAWSFNVFCAIKNNRILALYFYEDNLNSERYLSILRNVISANLHTLPEFVARNAWYQMDGAPAHTSGAVGEVIEEMFGDRWFAHNGPYKFPPRSPDLTPLDYFIWGYVKDQVYSTPVTTKDDLRNRVRGVFNALDGEAISRATHLSILKRIEKCLSQEGDVFEHLL